MRVIVIGGGWAGLSATLALGRSGHEMTLFGRDSVDLGGEWTEAFSWKRPGLPHFHLPHAFLARAHKELQQNAPDVLNSVLAHGGFEVDLSQKIPGGPTKPEDEDLIAVGARRPLLEWAFRRSLADEPNARVVGATEVTGLAFIEGLPPRVTGVIVDGSEVHADLVVDATGRNSKVPEWLATAGVKLQIESSDCQTNYYCRYFKFKEGADMPKGPWPFGPRADTGYGGYNTFYGDNGTFAVILTIPNWDRELRILRHEQAWMHFARCMNGLDYLVDENHSEPITGILPMGNLHNRINDTFPEGDPAVLGLQSIGDAYVHTNPMLAWGLSVSLIHAFELPRSIERTNGNPYDLAADFRNKTWSDALAYYRTSTELDGSRSARWRGEPIDPLSADSPKALFLGVAGGVAGMKDPDIFRRTTRRVMLLDSVDDLESDAEALAMIEQTAREVVAANPPKAPGPSRQELLHQLSTLSA